MTPEQSQVVFLKMAKEWWGKQSAEEKADAFDIFDKSDRCSSDCTSEAIEEWWQGAGDGTKVECFLVLNSRFDYPDWPEVDE
jgi:hypothetical protein